MIHLFYLFSFIYAGRLMNIKTDSRKFLLETRTVEDSKRGRSNDYLIPFMPLYPNHGRSLIPCQKCGVEYQCGTDYIYNGEATKEDQYPWMVNIPGIRCGGALVASKYVLTAAHCVVDGDTVKGKNKLKEGWKDWELRLGFYDYYSSQDTCLPETTVKVAKVIVHKKYILEQTYGELINIENDIALLQLKEEVDLSLYTPVCLPKQGLKTSSIRGPFYHYGWGDGSRNVLNQMVIDNIVEQKPFKQKKGESISYFAREEDRQSVGQGDSGGPLTYKKNNHHVLVGVASFGLPRNQSNWAQVSHYRDWIDKKMKNPKFCLEGTEA